MMSRRKKSDHHHHHHRSSGGGGGGGSGGRVDVASNSSSPSSMQTYHPPCGVKMGVTGSPPPSSVRRHHQHVTSVSTMVNPNSFETDPAFLLACREGHDDHRVRHLMTSRRLTQEMVNCRDKTGKTGVSHICVNGNLPLLELVSQIPCLDVNLGDNEGNTPLHFAAQAGHVELLHHLLNHFKNLQIDARNVLGFTALMKASLQGRTKCVKLLLAAGASPVLRDFGRGLCASEWARFCGRYSCAEALEKFMRNSNYSPASLRKQLKDLEKCNSEPNLQLVLRTEPKEGWLKQKIKKAFKQQGENGSINYGGGIGGGGGGSRKTEYSLVTNLSNVALCASSPLVPTANVKGSPPVSNGTGHGGLVGYDSKVMVLPKLEVTDANQMSEALMKNYQMRSGNCSISSPSSVNQCKAAYSASRCKSAK